MSIFDQLGKIVTSPSGQAAPEQARSAYLSSLEQSKEEVMEKLSGLFAELGKAYYENHRDDHGTEYEVHMAAIRETDGDVARCQQQIDEISAHRRCLACGAELVEGSVFCNFCGIKLPDIPSGTEKSSQRLCPQCQAVLRPDDIFCVLCGTDLRK